MSAPSLSVVIPTRNYGHYLGSCLDALLTQSVLPDEILVVDDASSDDTPGIVRAAQHRDGRVRLLRLDQTVGLFGALDRGLEEARGDCLYLHS
ncbi:MAG: glycosyltransferase family 2 protein, partial [Vicinamibacterales bacterium]